MQFLKSTFLGAAEPRRPFAEAALRFAAAGLAAASAALTRVAHELGRPVAKPKQHVPHLEFYAEAGAPEGALYRDGKLVGWLAGVTRL